MSGSRIAIINFGMGNLRSVEKAFHYVGATGAFVTDDPAEVMAAERAVLPGDGAFDATMHSLRRTGTDQIVRDFVSSGRSFLGICVGMQVLMTESEEGESGVQGLGIVPGRVCRFSTTGGLRVPHIGWNNVRFLPASPLGAGLSETPTEPMAYFLHSYYCIPDNPSDIAAETDYGISYCSALHRGNVWATQFHPEKSGPVGLSILRNFSAL